MKNNAAPHNGEKQERVKVEINGNGKKLTFDLGNLITIAVLLATMAVAWGTINSRVEENIKDIEQQRLVLTACVEMTRDNAAMLRATEVSIDKNSEAINSLRTGWNAYVAASAAETTQVRESLAGIKAQLEAMSKQLDKLGKE